MADDWEITCEDWETAVINFNQSNDQKQILEDREKVLASDFENTRYLFEEEDETLNEEECKRNTMQRNILPMIAVKKEKRIMSKDEIKRRDKQAKANKVKLENIKAKKSYNDRNVEIFG